MFMTIENIHASLPSEGLYDRSDPDQRVRVENPDEHYGGGQISATLAEEIYGTSLNRKTDTESKSNIQMDLFSVDMDDEPDERDESTIEQSVDSTLRGVDSSSFDAPKGGLDRRSREAASVALNIAARRGQLGPRTSGNLRYKI